MEFKKGSGWKACYDEERNLYTAERGGVGYYHLLLLDKQALGGAGTVFCLCRILAISQCNI